MQYIYQSLDGGLAGGVAPALAYDSNDNILTGEMPPRYLAATKHFQAAKNYLPCFKGASKVYSENFHFKSIEKLTSSLQYILALSDFQRALFQYPIALGTSSQTVRLPT